MKRKYEGYCDPDTLPIKKFDWVKIPKGTPITKARHGTTLAGKAYTVRVDHVLPGRTDIVDGKPVPISNPKVRWPGESGWWCDADINLVVKVTRREDNGEP